MRYLRLISRIIIGSLFIFSGTVKAIDPLGTVYKFNDYFQAFHLGSLKEISLALAILLCTLEFLAGFSVLLNIRFKPGIFLVMILMTLFTPLTLILAITNPVTDCGCFGDAVHLTNWQTFFKNLILSVPAVFLFISRDKIASDRGITMQWVITGLMTMIFLSFIFFNLRYLPVIDFLPYTIGTHITDKMIIPPGKSPDRFETTLIYEKGGKKKEFSLNNYPAADSSWKFVDQKSVLVSKGYQPPIHDLTFTDQDGEDLTRQILNYEGWTLLMVSTRLEDADPGHLQDGFELGRFCSENGISFYTVTASESNKVQLYSGKSKFCLTDETTLKTMVRANPGYLLLSGGTIAGKWSWANVPDKESLAKIIKNK